jgi:HSP20 family molecular chaperone IbpA
MALLPFYRYRFFNDPFFFHELDFFDPWFDFDLFPPFAPFTTQFESYYKRQDRLTYSSTNPTNSAKSLEQTPQIPQPEKFRVQLDIDGFNPDAIKKRVEGRKLIVEGKQEEHRNEHNYTSRQMRETHDLPENAG